MQPHQELEVKWAEFNELDQAGMVACSSGTAALHLALEAMQLPQGSKCIVPDFTMIACPRAVTLAGLEPVFVDCGDDLNIDWKLTGEIHGTLGDPLSAVMVVHVYGRRCDMDAIHGEGRFINDSGNLPVIEDLAEAHGVRPHQQTDAACWSHYRNKIVCGEEGGAVWFRDPKHAALARQLRSLGFTDAHDFNHVPRGHNYRMSDAHAALVLDSLLRYEDNVQRRWANIGLLERYCPQEWKIGDHDAPWVYDLRIKGMTGWQQNDVVRMLQSCGIAARHAFKPMHQQEEYNRCRIIKRGTRDGKGINAVYDTIGQSSPTCVSDIASREVIYLPIGPCDVVRPSASFQIILDTLGIAGFDSGASESVDVKRPAGAGQD